MVFFVYMCTENLEGRFKFIDTFYLYNIMFTWRILRAVLNEQFIALVIAIANNTDGFLILDYNTSKQQINWSNTDVATTNSSPKIETAKTETK